MNCWKLKKFRKVYFLYKSFKRNDIYVLYCIGQSIGKMWHAHFEFRKGDFITYKE